MVLGVAIVLAVVVVVVLEGFWRTGGCGEVGGALLRVC